MELASPLHVVGHFDLLRASHFVGLTGSRRGVRFDLLQGAVFGNAGQLQIVAFSWKRAHAGDWGVDALSPRARVHNGPKAGGGLCVGVYVEYACVVVVTSGLGDRVCGRLSCAANHAVR